MKVAFLGATKGMGRALARLMAQRGDRLFLLGRDAVDLEKSARDLEVRGGHPVATAQCDLEAPETFAPALLAAETALGELDTVVVTAGLFATQDRLEADPELTRRLLLVDFTNTVVFCEEARRRLQSRGGGRCASSARWRASGDASPSCSTERPRPDSLSISRASITASARRACAPYA